MSQRRFLRTLIGAAACMAATAAIGAHVGQEPAPAAGAGTPLSFEVASVKVNNSGDGRVMFGMQPGGRFTATNVTLRELIRFAYQVQNFQMVGGPDWMSSERFDVLAKAEGAVPMTPPAGSPGPVNLMMQSLLADRFKLVVHHEQREMPVYALVQARRDGRLGPNIQESTVDCAATAAGRGRGNAPPVPPGPPAPGQRPPCGMLMGPGRVAAGGVPLSQLATLLSPRVGRIVLDETGLTGRYEFELEFTPDQMPAAPLGAAAPDAPLATATDGASIFTALQEQLGLKLDSKRAPVDVLVIDSVDRPTED